MHTYGQQPTPMTNPTRHWALILVIYGLLPAAFAVAADWATSNAAPDVPVRPGENFYRYANGTWLAATTMPAGVSSYGTSAMLSELNKQRVHDLIVGASVQSNSRTSLEQKVGDFYVSQLNQHRIEAHGLKPIANNLAAISAIADVRSLSAYLGRTLPLGDGANVQAEGVFNVWFHQGFTESTRYLPHLQQGGLGLGDRSNYIDDTADNLARRARYQTYVAALMRQIGKRDPEGCAARILALEADIARSHASRADTDDVYKENNAWKGAEFAAKAPGLDWAAFFSAANLAAQDDFVVWQPSALIGTSALVAHRPIGQWQDYLTFHLLHHYASVLPRAYRNLYLAYSDTPSNGPNPIESRAVAATNAALGDAIGQLYVARYFPPEAKSAATGMVENLRAALANRIRQLTWMTPATRGKASAKLAALRMGLGYPDSWVDYTALVISPTDALGNIRRVEQFNFTRQLAKLHQPVDPDEWSFDPQIVGALINFAPNAEQFSAGLLQPPYFDYQGDGAANYGSAGAGIAHEMIHSFDELGNQYDAQGRLERWWTTEDLAQYRTVTAPLIAQCGTYCPLPGLCVHGEQVLGESSADLAGLEIAHDAYVLSLNGQPDTDKGELSGDQRFFLAFAQRWRKLQPDADLRHQIETDIHLPAEFRADAVRNADAWYEAYHVRPEDRLYLPRDRRLRVW